MYEKVIKIRFYKNIYIKLNFFHQFSKKKKKTFDKAIFQPYRFDHFVNSSSADFSRFKNNHIFLIQRCKSSIHQCNIYVVTFFC